MCCEWSVDDCLKVLCAAAGALAVLSIVWTCCVYLLFCALGRLFREDSSTTLHASTLNYYAVDGADE